MCVCVGGWVWVGGVGIFFAYIESRVARCLLQNHLAGIVTAAVFSDAAHIEEIALLKTRTSGATRATAAADPIE